MEFQYKKLEQFSSRVYWFRRYSYKEYRELSPQFEHLECDKYAFETLILFDEMMDELNRNKVLCSSPSQVNHLLEYYSLKLHDYFLDFGDLFIKGREQSSRTYLGGVDSPIFKKENEQIIEMYLPQRRQFRVTFLPETISFKPLKSKGDSKTSSLERIKWLGSPEQFGYIFGELASKGYIELPTKNGEGVFSKLAELSLMYFELTTTKGKNVGKQTTPENLERALNPETNQLSIKGKANLKLPPIMDLK